MELDHEEEIDLASSGDSAEECESGSSKQICPSLTLLLDPVSADHHNTQYTCTVSTSSEDGMQEDTVDVTVQSKSLCECCAFNTKSCMLVDYIQCKQILGYI